MNLERPWEGMDVPAKSDRSTRPDPRLTALVRRLGILIRARLAGTLTQATLKRLVRGVYFTERRVPR